MSELVLGWAASQGSAGRRADRAVLVISDQFEAVTMTVADHLLRASREIAGAMEKRKTTIGGLTVLGITYDRVARWLSATN